MKSSVPFWLTLTTFSMLVGCASAPSTTDSSAAGTLGALANTQVNIEKKSLENASVQAALESYRKAANLFDDPAQRNASIQRMAALAMEHAEKVPTSDNDISLSENPSLDVDQLDKKIDKRLYDSYMAGAIHADDSKERKQMLGMADRYSGSLDEIDLKGDLKTAIELYKLLLESEADPNQRADTYYRLARAYDLDGDLDNELKALDALTQEHPNSIYYAESQFRRGEMLFSFSEFDTAAIAYQAVLNEEDIGFHDQSLYKLGWSQYKLSEYKQSLDSFYALLRRLAQNANLLDNSTSVESKLHADTMRVIALSYTNLDGPETTKKWFAEHPQDKQFEKESYRSLGDIYLRQERYRDAAETYATFVSVHPQDDSAPEFSSLEINSYETGNFPTLVLPAKQNFTERYGIHSSYWASHEHIRDDYATELKKHLLDLATFYHAEAQKTNKPNDFQQPVRWYKEYLATPPASKEQAEINMRYASALYAAEDFNEAITQFETTAYEYEGFDKANQAGYAALLAYQSAMDELSDQQTKSSKQEAVQQQISDLRTRKIESGLRFATVFNSDEQVPDVLKNITEDYLAEDDIENAVKAAGMLVNRQPTPDNNYLLFGWAVIADGEFDLERYDVAEFAYGQLLTLPGLDNKQRKDYHNKQAMTVYQQAANLERAGDSEAAAQNFLRVADIYPDADIRHESDFTAAAIYLKLEQYSTAIPILLDFEKRFPDDEKTETIPAKLAVAYEQTGDYSAAAAQLEIISDRYATTDKELAAQGLWKAAKMQDKAENSEKSIRLYEKYVQLYPTPYEMSAEAHYALLELYRKTGNISKEQGQLKALVATREAAGKKATTRINWLGAYAAFELAEPLYQEFSDIKLTLPLKNSLARKSAAMRNALESYTVVAKMNVAEFTPAANYRIATLYQTLSSDIMDSDRPTGMDELEAMQYDMLLEDQALPYSDKAIDIYTSTAELAYKNIYNVWVKQSYDRLAELVPGRYAKHEQVESYVDIIY